MTYNKTIEIYGFTNDIDYIYSEDQMFNIEGYRRKYFFKVKYQDCIFTNTPYKFINPPEKGQLVVSTVGEVYKIYRVEEYGLSKFSEEFRDQLKKSMESYNFNKNESK